MSDDACPQCANVAQCGPAMPKEGEVWRMVSNGKRYEVTRVERTDGYPWAVVYSVGADAQDVTREMDCPIKAWHTLFELCQRVP